MTASVTNISKKRIERLDLDLDHQVDTWCQALLNGEPTRGLFAIMKATEAEINQLEKELPCHSH